MVPLTDSKNRNATSQNEELLKDLSEREQKTLDSGRESQAKKRHEKGYLTARENLQNLCSTSSFLEYGQFAVAAQRQRKPYEELQTSTAADGIITGVGNINDDLFSAQKSKTAVIINDYSVLAGTQGYYHHLKIDRMLEVAKQEKLPVIMFTEGGGGRPGDTDITTVNSGLQCSSFSTWAGLDGIVPRITVNNGYCFAGNAALFGAADVTIATKTSWIGMAGPAMIEGGGLGSFAPQQIGPIDTQAKNGTVDIVCENEEDASQVAKKCLSYFQGETTNCVEKDQNKLLSVLPEDRRFVYNIRKIIETVADEDSFLEIRQQFGGSILTGFIRINGQPIGLLASDCKVLGGAIDVAAGEKATSFMTLCNNFSIPLVSLCDTPGFMVGPDHEELGAVRRLSDMFRVGAKLRVPMIAVIIRKCYGLGAQALLGGSTKTPTYTISWPNGEFGPMGLEGAVKLGFKKELESADNPEARKALYERLLAQQYQRGKAIEVASVLEIDAVIDPVNTRQVIINALGNPRRD